MIEPQAGTFWSHYKRPDRCYLVLSCATNRTTNVREVIYMALYDDPNVERFHTRTVEEWNEKVSVPYPPPCQRGMQILPRFEQVEPNAEMRTIATRMLMTMAHNVIT